MKIRKSTFVLIALAAWLSAGAALSDEDRFGAWRYRREIMPPPGEQPAGEAFGSVLLPPEIEMLSQQELGDLRLIGGDQSVVPFLLDKAESPSSIRVLAGKLIDVRRVPGKQTVWLIDLGESASFDKVDFEVSEREFMKRADLECSSDRTKWRTLVRDAGLFRTRWNVPIRHTAIELPRGAKARFLRLSLNDETSTPISISGVKVEVVAEGFRHIWEREVSLVPSGGGQDFQRYRINLRHGMPLGKARLEVEDRGFVFQAKVIEEREGAGTASEIVLCEKQIYRIPVSGGGQSLTMRLQGRAGEKMYLDILHGKSAPPAGVKMILSGVSRRLLFPVRDRRHASLALLYGNPAAEPVRYDLEQFRSVLAKRRDLAIWRLGEEGSNPLYRRAVPLDFLPARGAAIDPSEWHRARPLRIGPEADIYAVTLEASDLAWLKPDFADIRIVDERGNQVPFVLVTGAAQDKLQLKFGRYDLPADKKGVREFSRYRIKMPAGDGRAFPIQKLELEFAESFFSRPMTIEVEEGDGARDLSGQLKKSIEGAVRGKRPGRPYSCIWQGVVNRGRSETGPVRIFMAGGRYRELFLLVRDGDNQPLTLIGARAVVSLPRIVFKLDPGDDKFQILMGNNGAKWPDYEIHRLRSEMLAYEAVGAALGPAGRPFKAGQRINVGAIPASRASWLLWGAIFLTVVVLLIITVRLSGSAARE